MGALTEGQWLYALLVLLYALECLVWIPRGAGMVIRKGKRASYQAGGDIELGGAGAVTLAPLFPWDGPLALTSPGSISFGKESVVGVHHAWLGAGLRLRRPPPVLEPARYESLADLRACDQAVMAGKRTVAHTPGVEYARAEIEALNTLAARSPADRSDALAEVLARRLDDTAAAARWEEIRRAGYGLKLLCSAQFLFVFALCPFVAHWMGLSNTFWGLLAGMLALHAGIVALYVRAFRAVHGQALPLWKPLLKFVPSPPMAMRAGLLLGREAMARFHPCAVLEAAQPGAGVKLSELAVRDAAYPLQPEGLSPEAARVESDYREALRRALLAWREQRQAPPPGKPPAESPAFCPRCLIPLELPLEPCPDCPGVMRLARNAAP